MSISISMPSVLHHSVAINTKGIDFLLMSTLEESLVEKFVSPRGVVKENDVD
jgi:hypothetical protein